MTRAPDVSIIVCTYNRAPSLRLTLEALGAQRTPPDLAWELVIVDNNSSDATRDVIQTFTEAAPIRVRSLFVEEQGVSHARNAGLARCHGAIVGFTDDDVEPPPDWVSQIVTVLDERRADIVGGRIVPLWGQPPPPRLERSPSLEGAVAIMLHPTPEEIVNAGGSPTVWGANMALRRSVFDVVGGFDTRRGLIGTKLYRGEEIDLVQRAIAAGFRAVYDPRLVVSHRIAAERVGLRYLSRLHFQRAEGEALVQASVGRGRLLGRALSGYSSMPWQTVRLIAGLLRRRPDTLERWLDYCAAAGFMWGVCRLYFRRTPAAR